MGFSPTTKDRLDSTTVSRFVVIALVGVLLVSAIGGVIGSSSIAAAQANGSAGNNTTAGNATATGGNGTNISTDDPVNATIQEFQRQNLGYENLSASKKQEIRSDLRELNSGDLSQLEQNRKIANIQSILSSGPLMGPNELGKPKKIIENHLDASSEVTTDGDPTDGPLLSKIDSLTEGQLKGLGDSFKNGATDVLANVYDLAFTTAVPENDGWRGIFGTPTNEPFQSLHQNLLSEKLYPVTNRLLGIGVLLLGVSLVVNPLVSRFRALDLIIKFTTFLLFYGFSWAAITLMHGAVNDITLWMRPSEEAMAGLVTSVDKMGATATGAYFFGSGGILTTAFGLGFQLGMRRVLIEYVFPYVFPVLVFFLYTSPWQRLRGYASMAIWQYVNLLTMVIPMAILLSAATAVEFSPGEGIEAMLILIALFLAAVSIPFVSTYFFIQMPGKVAGGVRSAASSAASRIGDAKEKIGSGGDVSATDSTATAGSNPDDRTEEAVEARQADETSSGLPSSGTLDLSPDGKRVSSDSPDTTAAEVRKLDEEDHADPMNNEAMKESFFEHPRRTTMEGKLAD